MFRWVSNAGAPGEALEEVLAQHGAGYVEGGNSAAFELTDAERKELKTYQVVWTALADGSGELGGAVERARELVAELRRGAGGAGGGKRKREGSGEEEG